VAAAVADVVLAAAAAETAVVHNAQAENPVVAQSAAMAAEAAEAVHAVALQPKPL